MMQKKTIIIYISNRIKYTQTDILEYENDLETEIQKQNKNSKILEINKGAI